MDSTSSPWWSGAAWWPPQSSTPEGVGPWSAAVDLGARGRAAAARAALGSLIREARDPRIVSLAYSTRASLTRQAGGHAQARADDARACLLVASAARGRRDDWAFAAWIDGLIGLAADGLGIGDFAGSRTLLARVSQSIDGRGDVDSRPWIVDGRLRLRHAWVRTELALFSGDTPGSVGPGREARRLGADAPSPRHIVKTDLISAAVAAAGGDGDTAAEIAADCENRCITWGLLPLQWAAATMLTGIGPDPDGAARRAAESADRLAALGMRITPAA